MSQIRPITVSVKEAARLLGVSPWTIRKRCVEGSIESRFEGTRRLVDFGSLEQYAKSLPSSRVEGGAA